MVRRLLVWISVAILTISAAAGYAEDSTSERMLYEASDRELDTLPNGITVCDEYFFGRQTAFPYQSTPFCVNSGTCKANWIQYPDQPCQCLATNSGPHCEFYVGEAPSTCSLGCRNGGKCALGSSSWQLYYRNQGPQWTNPLDLEHCVCPTGYTGTLCELLGAPCGDGRCHNGGTCVLTSQADGSNNYVCDCSTAKTSSGVAAYAGQYCEHEATSFCTQSTYQSSSQFCVNGGTCSSDSHLGCNCPTGFVGPVCEFKDLGQDPLPCNLTCQNHGICRAGAGDTSSLSQFGVPGDAQLAYNNSTEHCACPSGYVGLQCEYQLDQCPGGSHACLNGGQCVTTPDGSKATYSCDCTNAQSTLSRFAGAYCEMESTQFCTIDGGKSLDGVGLDSFCTNGGKCRQFVAYTDKHPGCDCHGGFEGANCEYATVKQGPNMAGIIAGIIVVAIVVSVGVLLLIRRKRSQLKLYDHVEPALPSTLDIIRALGHDREAEYTDGASVGGSIRSRSTSVSVRCTEDMVVIRKPYWTDASYDASHPFPTFDDAPLDVGEMQSARRTYWPNDARNDAANPIHVFEDISVRSVEEHSTSSNTSSSGGDDDGGESISLGSDEQSIV